MKAARRLISGEGEFEKGWKRLLGLRRRRLVVSGEEVDAGPGAGGISITSLSRD